MERQNRPFELGSAPGADRRSAAAEIAREIKSFNEEECRAALKLPDLQKTVRTAIERRLRKLAKEKA